MNGARRSVSTTRRVRHQPAGPRFGRPNLWGAGGQSPRLRRSSRRERAQGVAVRDAQAGVPSAGWPRAQLAFKDSMVHGILQFTTFFIDARAEISVAESRQDD